MMIKNIFTAIFISTILSGCQLPKEQPEPTIDPVQQQAEEKLQQQKRMEKFVEVNAESMAAFAMKFAKSEDVVRAIQKTLSTEKLLQSKDLQEIYKSHQYSPLFVMDGVLPDMLEPLIREFERLDQHGLSHINISAWLDARQALADVQQGELPQTFAFTKEEQSTIAQLIIERNIDISSSKAIKTLISDLVRDKNLLPRLHQTVYEKARKLAKTAQMTAQLDVLTADIAMRFARAMAFENMTHLTAAEKKIAGTQPTDAQYKKIAAARTLTWINTLVNIVDAPIKSNKPTQKVQNNINAESANAESPENIDPEADALATEEAAAEATEQKLKQTQSVSELVQALYPPHPDYLKLMEAQAMYAQLPDWASVKSGRLSSGSASSVVPALKTRLAIEGYYHGDISEEAAAQKNYNIYDKELRAAVHLYHDTHQIAYEDGRPITDEFWESLNTPRSKRLAQIEENLRRWHKTQIIDSPYYIYINVPDFHGEIWRDHQKVYRFPVVTGNSKRACNPETHTWQYINATPLMHSRMLYLEYNPYWVVPPRIEQEEYIEKINADPNWLKDHGFEYYTQNGKTVLRQLPGENNALGRVKFIFPNPHSTFLHDSPQKKFFKYPIRAFSHGCMRVWEPLELAKRLLQYDGQWRDSLPDEIDTFQLLHFNFNTRFDIFIDYFTVKMDDDGMVNFLADPYRYVRNAINPPSAASMACTPKPKAWIPRKGQVGDDVGAEEN